jgi:hypothetical protein
MAGYDPKRPRPAPGGDDPAPVEALIDLADHKSPADPTRLDLTTSGSTPSGDPGSGSSTSAPQAVSSEAAAQDHITGRRSRLVLAGVLAACAAVLLVLALRRRRS